MDATKYGKYFYYVISVFLLITGLFGINRLMTKADLPFSYKFLNNKLILSEKFEFNNNGDLIISVNGINIKSIFQLETILDGKSIGDDTNLEIVSKNNKVSTVHVHLTRYYRNLNFIIISFLVGLSFWITSVFLVIKKSGERAVKVLFWVLLLFSTATMTSPGKYYPGNDWIAFLVRAAHVSLYFLGSAAFLYFTFVFPRVRFKKIKIFTTFLYFTSILYCFISIFVQINSILFNTSEWVFIMEKLWVVTESLLLFCVISGSLNLLMYYLRINDRQEKKKIEWIFWGLAAGVFPFLFLWLLPRILGFNEIIREEFMLAFMILVPAFFTMAVVKYHVFEINVFVKRSILYSVLTFITVLIYFAAITLITFFANDLLNEYSNLVSISLILLIAFIFNPMQNKIRHLIDKTFYRESFDFEQAVSSFSVGIKDQNTIAGLSNFAISEIRNIIPSKKIAIIACSDPDEKINILSEINFSDLREFLQTSSFKKLLFGQINLFVQEGKVEPGIITNNSISDVLEKQDINLIITSIPEPKDIAGAIIMGDKLSKQLYSKKDIDILNILISNISLAYKKLQLQRKLVLEEIEKSRLEELNKKMSYYVSSVSHDLKTPLTSIKIFTEILKEQNSHNNSDSKEYLDIIEGESDRLTRLINNVLNFTMIENGIKEYSFGKTDLNHCIEEVLKIMEYQFAMENFKIEYLPCKDIYIEADKDALKEILINLLTNAVKFSPYKKFIRISVSQKNEYAIISIEDKGTGISKEELKNIFDPYVRLKNSGSVHTGGAGIGLSIVKNIMEAHKGKIEVKSVLGEGSTFILYFKKFFQN